MYYICTLAPYSNRAETTDLTLSTPMPTHLPVKYITDELQAHLHTLTRDFEDRHSTARKRTHVIRWEVLVYDSPRRNIFLGGFTRTRRASSVRPGCRWYQSVEPGHLPTGYRNLAS